MNILITGANGFIGKNLALALQNIKDKKDLSYKGEEIGEIYLFDTDTSAELLETYCSKADFAFHLAGVNRPKDNSEFKLGNEDFSSHLLSLLKKHNNTCPVMFSSSVHAENTSSDYGISKRNAEKLFFKYSLDTGAKVLVYRFTNVFGKWCRPNYNSAVATFCYNIARNLPITVSDESISLNLVYIDDIITELLNALNGKESRCKINDKEFCYVPTVHTVTLGEIVKLIKEFASQPDTLIMPEIAENSFAKKLYSTYLSYLPEEKVAFSLNTHSDERGSFTELLKTEKCGQVSVNIIKPGITKGQHWHNSKWEFFITVSGSGVIRQRKVGTDEIIETYTDGENIKAVHILPGYTHNIQNLSESENMVVVMWANESFDKNRPDTFFEVVE